MWHFNADLKNKEQGYLYSVWRREKVHPSTRRSAKSLGALFSSPPGVLG